MRFHFSCDHGNVIVYLRQSDRVDEVIAFSERTVSGLEMAHQEATREREESEHRLLQELHRLKHCHPEVHLAHKPQRTASSTVPPGRRGYLSPNTGPDSFNTYRR